MRASFWSKEVLHVRRLHAAFMDRSFHMLHLSFAFVLVCLAGVEVVGAAGGVGGAIRRGVDLDDTGALCLCVSVPSAEVLAVPAEDRAHSVGVSCGARGACVCKLVVRVQASVWCCWWVLTLGVVSLLKRFLGFGTF